MRHNRWCFNLALLCLVLFCFLYKNPVFAQNPNAHVPGEILVQLKPAVRASAWATQQASLRAAGSGFTLDEVPLSEHMHIWRVRFDPATQNENELLAQIRRDPVVVVAQFNHYVEWRSAIPNDPEFAKQWYMNNNGQDGGTVGLDIGVKQAWDITTGGLTPNSDTIVICVIDNGIDTGHMDLKANLWKNRAEIPNNNIDDDENGYIDDYHGWNIRRRSDNISEEAVHGTEVAGFIGAVGNNNVGIAGVNWKVKIMGVVGGFNSSTEDIIIQAFNYPFLQRKLYNQSGGKKGAFVVATNSSWGLPRATPQEYPIWCSFFDSLGHQGIVNVIATSNDPIDVDVTGDMPGACSSPFIVNVTSISRTGALNHGYGKTTVDLGSFGEQAITTAKNNGYITTSGTSFAAPQVAGAIGLLYSAPCPTLSSLSRRDPQAAALWIRRLLLENVKPYFSLANKTTTGGFLHIYSSLVALGKECGACPSLVSIAVSDITTTSAKLSWTSNDSIQRVDLRFRTKGSTTWTILERALPPYNFTNLKACTDYEFQLKSYCRNVTLDFDEIFTFRTDGCCDPPAKITIPLGIISSTIIRWEPVTAASSYTFRYRIVGTSAWTALTPPFTSVNLRNLQACTEYELQIRSECLDGTSSVFSKSYTFKTGNCGACLDMAYCKETILIDQAEQEWITGVQVGNFNNRSGRNGYGDFTGLKGLDLRSGQSYSFKTTMGYKGQLFNEFVVAWIDFNQDGQFGANEAVYNSGAKKDTVFSGMINVPTRIPAGPTRMRVMLRYNTEPSTCFSGSNNYYGEVEDYCVNIDMISTATETLSLATRLQVFPNPFQEEFIVGFQLPSSAPKAQLEVWNAQGQRMYSRTLSVLGNTLMQENVPAQDWPTGLYLVRLHTGQGKEEVWGKVLKAQ